MKFLIVHETFLPWKIGSQLCRVGDKIDKFVLLLPHYFKILSIPRLNKDENCN